MAKTSKVVIFIGIATKPILLKSCQMNAMRTALLCAALLGLLAVCSAAPLDAHPHDDVMLGKTLRDNTFFLGNSDPNDPNRAFNNLKITDYIYTDGQPCDGTLYQDGSYVTIKCGRHGTELGERMASQLNVNFTVGLGWGYAITPSGAPSLSPAGQVYVDCKSLVGIDLGDLESSHINFAFKFTGEHRITGCKVAFVIAQVKNMAYGESGHNGYHIYATTDNPDAVLSPDGNAVQFPSCGVEIDVYPTRCDFDKPFTFSFI